MTESDTVVQNARLRVAPVMPINRTGASDGTIETLAHLKMASRLETARFLACTSTMTLLATPARSHRISLAPLARQENAKS